jgi:hypothetical protein
VVELEPGVVAAECERRQPKVFFGERRKFFDLAPEIVREPPGPEAVAEPLEIRQPGGRDLPRPHGEKRAAAERTEARPALEQDETGLVSQIQGSRERLRPGQ